MYLEVKRNQELFKADMVSNLQFGHHFLARLCPIMSKVKLLQASLV